MGASPTYTVAGVTLGGGTGAWSSTNTVVATVNSSGVVTTVGAGTTDITYTITGGCGGTKSSFKTLTVDGIPTTALVGSNQTICGALTSNPLGGNTPTVGTGVWSQVSGPGTSTFSASTSGSSTATASTNGSYVYKWTISNGSCTASSANVTVLYGTSTSTPVSGGNQTACNHGSIPDLTATVNSGEVVDWYDASTGGTLVYSGSPFTTGETTTGTYTYYAEGRNTTSGCTSSSRTIISLTINDVPTISPTATPSAAICSGTSVTLDAGATAGSGTITTYAWSAGIAGNVSSGSVSPTATATYHVTVTNSNSCTSENTVIVDVKSAATLVILPTSTTTTCVEQCTDGGWTYFANASAPDDWIFAIDKNGNSFTASVDITVAGGTINHINTTKAGYENGSYLMKRYWNVNLLSGSISSSVNVKFFYDAAEKAAAQSARDAAWAAYPSTTKTAFRWFKTVGIPFNALAIDSIDGNSFNKIPNITLTEAASGVENNITYAQFNGITSFSGGTGGYGFSSPGTGLPVKLLYFTATAVDNSYIKLDWSTSLEIDNKGFDIERSTDGVHFDKIGWVDGNGNSTQNIVYSFNDKTAQANTVYYYRLKQIDFDGDIEYSNIASAIFKDGKGFTLADLYPNPATNKVVISVATDLAQDAKIKIFDLLGQPVLVNDVNLVSGSNNFELDLTDFAGGTYTVSIFSGNQYITKKLVVSR
jgi:hypothetical protein